MEKTKIICTLGPSTTDRKTVLSMIKCGMDCARINMSHGDHESLQILLDNLKNCEKEANVKIDLIVDTKGPEIRLGNFKNKSIVLQNNAEFILSKKQIIGDEKSASISRLEIFEQLKIGYVIFANNGMLKLKVKKITTEGILCKVISGGKLSSHKGLNIPKIVISGEYLSDIDKKDILFGIKNKANYIASSFVSKKQDILDLRQFLDENNAKNIKIIAKIENLEGIKNIKDIISVSDGIMVARGDMGVELPLERVPLIQKKICKLCLKLNKPCIIATEMLESMTLLTRPTRAEVSDVANAVLDECSAVMLSGETAIGKHPALCVKFMSKILNETEKHKNILPTTNG